MVCCTLIAGLLALALAPFAAWRPSPLAWRLHGDATAVRTPLRGRMRSFGHAVSGLRFALHNEPNMRIHASVSALVVAAALWLGVEAAEWRWLIVAMILVIAAEAFNTAVEQCCNAIGLEYRPAIKAAKDVAAGAVLLCAAGAALIGTSIFLPYMFPAKAQAHHIVCGATRN
jgi:diacylglycerol kinase (ATP)